MILGYAAVSLVEQIKTAAFWTAILSALLLVFVLLLAIIALGMFIMSFADAAGREAALMIDEVGIHDFRQLQGPIRWADIEAIGLVSGGRGVVLARLDLRDLIYIRRNPFRPSGAPPTGGLFRSRPTKKLYIQITQLDRDEHTIAEVMKALLREIGGKRPS